VSFEGINFDASIVFQRANQTKQEGKSNSNKKTRRKIKKRQKAKQLKLEKALLQKGLQMADGNETDLFSMITPPSITKYLDDNPKNGRDEFSNNRNLFEEFLPNENMFSLDYFVAKGLKREDSALKDVRLTCDECAVRGSMRAHPKVEMGS
jgi:hypothetical protein